MGFNYNTNTGHTAGDWFSDNFLGSNNRGNKDALMRQNEQNRFTEYMSNTAYQRGNQDMVKAGINPMVMYANNGGSAKASTPTSSTQNPQTLGFGQFGKVIDSSMKVITDTMQFALNPQQKFDNALQVIKTFK